LLQRDDGTLLAAPIVVIVRSVALFALVAAPVAARPESQAELVGRAGFSGGFPGETLYGSVQVTLRGTGDIGDDCPDAAARQFVAHYDGALAVSPDGEFEAQLYARDPAVTTPSGCPITDLDVERVQTYTIEAALPDFNLAGYGWLRWQTLTAADNTDLQAGAFGSLYATLVFQMSAPEPRSRGPSITASETPRAGEVPESTRTYAAGFSE
jgi:hypothetical protein